MAYTLNSAKDARGDEHLFMEVFARHRAAIEQYQRTHGGDLEGAFQAVIGTPWPAGRSVKIANGVPEMTKDRTVLSVLGKYVAPIAGAVAAPYLLPLITGGGGAAAAGGVGLGETAAVTGLGGSGFAGSAGGLGATAVGAGGVATPVVAGGAEAGRQLVASRQTVPPSGDLPMGGRGVGPDSYTGGQNILNTLERWGGLVGDIGQTVTGAAAGSAEGRRADAEANARGIAENNRAKVEAARYNRETPSYRTNQVARGEVLNTMQDAPKTGDPRIDKFAGGGLRPSAFGPQSRQAGSELSRMALMKLMDPASDQLTPQEIEPTKPSTAENIAAGAGLGMNVFGLLSKYGKHLNGPR